MALENSKIRELLLKELEDVRAELGSLEAALDPCLANGTVPSLKAQLERVFLAVRRHALNELQLLEPVIRELDAWGPERAAQMDRERDELRELFAYFSSLDPASEPQRWVDEVKNLITHLREELADEERGRLSPELLRDDVIRVDFGG